MCEATRLLPIVLLLLPFDAVTDDTFDEGTTRIIMAVVVGVAVDVTMGMVLGVGVLLE